MNLEELFGNARIGDIARAFRGGFDGATGPVRDILDQIMTWGTHLTKHATAKWLPVALGNHKCSIPHGRSKCGAPALVKCDTCPRYSCLAHARIDYGANGTCSVCIAEFGAMRGNFHQTEPDDWASVRKAFKTLGVPEDATLAEVQGKYRELARKHHPDRGTTDKDRARREKKMKSVNAAFELLQRYLEAEEAA